MNWNYENYLSKWSFEDGERYPPFIDHLRTLECKVINRLAEEFGSNTRVFMWDRPGVHNCFFLSHINKEDFQSWMNEKPADGELAFRLLEQDTQPDDIFTDVVLDKLHDIPIEEFVSMKISIEPDIDPIIANFIEED